MSVSPPVAPAPLGAPSSKTKAVTNAVLAAVTSPEAVREEKSLAALVVTRLLLASGASMGVVTLVEAVIKAL